VVALDQETEFPAASTRLSLSYVRERGILSTLWFQQRGGRRKFQSQKMEHIGSRASPFHPDTKNKQYECQNYGCDGPIKGNPLLEYQFVEKSKNDDERCDFTEKLPHQLLDVFAARALVVAQEL